MLGYTDNAVVDSIHNEVFTAQFRSDSILVFRRDVGGAVAPIRIIHGPKTKLDRPFRLSVDPVNNLLAVTGIPGLLIFDSRVNGDVAPRWIIAGPKTGLGGEGSLISTPVLYPQGRKIIVAGGTKMSNSDDASDGIIGVWKYGESGDIPPWAVLHGSKLTKMTRASGGMDINPKAKELIISSHGVILFYRLPEVF